MGDRIGEEARSATPSRERGAALRRSAGIISSVSAARVAFAGAAAPPELRGQRQASSSFGTAVCSLADRPALLPPSPPIQLAQPPLRNLVTAPAPAPPDASPEASPAAAAAIEPRAAGRPAAAESERRELRECFASEPPPPREPAPSRRPRRRNPGISPGGEDVRTRNARRHLKQRL